MMFDVMILGKFAPRIVVHTLGSYTLYLTLEETLWGRTRDSSLAERVQKKADLDTITALIDASFDLRRHIRADI